MMDQSVRRDKSIRPFLGNNDIQRVTLYGAFQGSRVNIVSPVEIHDPWPAIVIEGPEFQVNFLHSYLLKLVSATVSKDDDKWDGVYRKNAERTDLFYKYSKEPWSRVELMEHRFRRDAMLYGNLKLAEVSLLEIIYADKQVFSQSIGLPIGLKNGEVEIPIVAFLH